VGAEARVERFRWEAPQADEQRGAMVAGNREVRESQGATMTVADPDSPNAALVCAERDRQGERWPSSG
jgi:hypothetical protein